MFINSKYKARKSIVACMIALLTGCNGASDDSSLSSGNNNGQLTPPSEVASTLSAENTVNLSRNMSSSHVLLEGKIHSSSQKGNNIVSSVSPITDLESCQDISFDSTGYSVSFDDFVGVCVYKYDATNSAVPDQKASAYAISVAQKSVDSEVGLFTPISETTLVGETLVIDLKSDPNFVIQVPDGYTMDKELTLIGEGEAMADETNQTITYTPTEDSGFAKIIYSYSNGSEVKLGNIAISVSTSANTAPIAPDIDYSNDPNGSRVNANEEVIIDLSTYVSDEDGDSLQLIYTDSWNAAVSPLDIEDTNNLKLRFETTKVGEHFVSYAVSDHYGGYATGMLRIEVYDSEAAPNWGNLPLDMKYYFAPLVKSEADAQGVTYTSTHLDVGANSANVATFNVAQAKELCKASGRLPTAEELAALANIGGVGPAAYDGWPVEIDYWALDSGSASIVSLKSGQTSETPNAGGQYVTCVGEGGYRIDSATSKLVAIGDGEDQASVAVQATFNGEPLEGMTVEAAVTGSANIVNNSLKTDANGYASFKVIDAISEQVAFTTNIENSEFTPTTQLQFTGNPNTAELELKTVTDNQPFTGVNVFESSLKDDTGAPVVGQRVDYEKVEHLTYNFSSELTDAKGKQTVTVSTDGQLLENQYPYVVNATYKRPNGTEDSKSLNMNFADGELKEVYGESGNSAFDTHNLNSITAMVKTNSNTPEYVIFRIQGPAVFEVNGRKELKTQIYDEVIGDLHKVTRQIRYAKSEGPWDWEKEIRYKVEAEVYGSTQEIWQTMTMAPTIEGKSGYVYVQLPTKTDEDGEETYYNDEDVGTVCQKMGLLTTQSMKQVSWLEDLGFVLGKSGPEPAVELMEAGWNYAERTYDDSSPRYAFGTGSLDKPPETASQLDDTYLLGFNAPNYPDNEPIPTSEVTNSYAKRLDHPWGGGYYQSDRSNLVCVIPKA